MAPRFAIAGGAEDKGSGREMMGDGDAIRLAKGPIYTHGSLVRRACHLVSVRGIRRSAEVCGP